VAAFIMGEKVAATPRRHAKNGCTAVGDNQRTLWAHHQTAPQGGECERSEQYIATPACPCLPLHTRKPPKKKSKKSSKT
jgi:hypothetical protein